MVKTKQINPAALAWLEDFSRELDDDPDIIAAMPIEDVRKELRNMGADVEGFHSKLAKILAVSTLKSKIKKAITWISELYVFPLAGQQMTALSTSEQSHPFEMDYGQYINISCYWQGKSGDLMPYLELSWNANLYADVTLWARFSDPDTHEIFSELCLGDKLEDKVRLEYEDLKFDPSTRKWGISVLLTKDQ